MSKITREAARDAAEFARAQMFYGEGAGNRRKLIDGTVVFKSRQIPGYRDAFYAALESQNTLKHVRGARRERHLRDAGKTVSKNARALARGDRRGMGPVVLSAVVIGTVLHETGYDKVLLREAKIRGRKAGAWVNTKRAEAKVYREQRRRLKKIKNDD